jgi:hypothetical protein
MIVDNLFEIVEEDDEWYKCYGINIPIQIFNHIMNGEELEEVRIYLSHNLQLATLENKIERYIHWFTVCETVLRNYYENELKEKVYNNWFNDIEVYRVDITFISEDHYCATITCGDTLLQDHILMISFNREQIQCIHLNG